MHTFGSIVAAMHRFLASIKLEILVPALATVFTGLLAILAAAASYRGKHRDDVLMQNRKDQLARINLQLRKLYGPIYMSAHAGAEANKALCALLQARMGKRILDGSEPAEELKIFRIWIAEVFVPINRRLESTLYENGDLLDGDDIDPCLLEACTHINEYKTILRRWQAGDFSDLQPSVAFPEEQLLNHLRTKYNDLKRRQSELIGMLNRRRGSWPARIWHGIRRGA